MFRIRGLGADGIPPCPAWENRPWWWLVVTVQGAPLTPCFHLTHFILLLR
jgi:hypothetical protein